MNDPEVSVVIPTRHRPELLAAALQSLSGQEPRPHLLEIVVVDNGPDRRTKMVVEAASGSPVRVRYVVEERPGVNRARNRGIREAGGDLIWLFDDDELSRPGVLERLLGAADSNPWAAALGGGCKSRIEVAVPRWVCRTCGSSVKSHLPAYEADRITVEVPRLLGGNALFRRCAFHQFGLFDERLSGSGDEGEWFSRARESGARFAYVPDAWVWHRVMARDFTPRHLITVGAKTGLARARARAVIGEHPSLRKDLRQAIVFLGHGLLSRCRIGLGSALTWSVLSFATPIVRLRYRLRSGGQRTSSSLGVRPRLERTHELRERRRR